MSAEFSDDSKLILTSGEKGQVKIWDAATGSPLRALTGYNTQDAVSSRFTPDGKYVVAINRSVNAKIRIWETLTGKLIHELDVPRSEKQPKFLSSCAIEFSPDGKSMITVSNDRVAGIWAVASGKFIKNLEGHDGTVTKAEFTPDGSNIITVGDDNTLRIWQASSGSLVKTIEEVTWGTLSSTGKYLIVESPLGNFKFAQKLLDRKTGKVLRVLENEKYSRHLLFDPSDKYIVEAYLDVRVWDVSTGKVLHTLKAHTQLVDDYQITPDGKFLFTVSRDKTIKQTNIALGQISNSIEFKKGGALSLLKVSPNGKYLLGASHDTFDFRLWDIPTRKEILVKDGVHSILTALSPDGNFILTSSDNVVYVWDAATGKSVRALQHNAILNTLVYSPEGKHVLTTCSNGVSNLWDAATGKLIYAIEDERNIASAYFSHDGSKIITRHKTNNHTSHFKIWTTSSGRLHYSVEGNQLDIPYSCELSPDSRYAVLPSLGMVPNCTIWKDGKFQNDITLKVDYIHTIAFSRDGKYFLSCGDGDINIWQTATGKLVRTIKDGGSVINVPDIHFNPFSADGRYFVSTSDNSSKIWELSTGRLFRTLQSDSPITLSHFSSDGRSVIVLTQSGVTWYEASSGKVIEQKNIKLKSGITLVDPEIRKALINDNSMFTYYDISAKSYSVSWTLVGGTDQVVVTPSGLFDATPGAMEKLYFVQGLDMVQFDQLKERYFEPNLWKKCMTGENLRSVVGMKSIDLPPDIRLGQVDEKGYLPIELVNRGGGIGEVAIYVQGKEVVNDARTKDASPNVASMKINYFIGNQKYLVNGENFIGVKAWNKDHYVVSRSALVTYSKGKQDKYQPAVHIIACGISDYAGGADIDLTYAAKDADDIGKALRVGAARLFGTQKSYVYALTTSQPVESWPTKTNIIKTFQKISSTAHPMDVVVVYFSGHGINVGGTEADWHYLTQDAFSTNLSAYNDPAIRQRSTISSNELVDLFKTIPASKQVLIIDACASGKVVDNMMAKKDIPSSTLRALDRMKDRMGMHIITGCASDAVSYEASRYGQGVLTYSLLEGIRGAALRDDEFVDVNRLFQYARERVPGLAEGIGGIQTPAIFSPQGAQSFDIGQLSEAEKKSVPISKVRPVYIQSNFQEESELSDILGLGKKIDQLLGETALKGIEAPLIFVPVREYPEGCQLVGRYQTVGGKIQLKLRKKCDGQDQALNITASGLEDLGSQIMKSIIN